MLYDSFDFDLILDDIACYDDSATTTSEDFSLSEFDCDSIDEKQVVIKPKKKRIRVRKPLPVAPGPKVIKNDIRRCYANMFINVLNSSDIHLMYGMLDTFFVPNFKQSFRKSINGEAHDEHSIDVQGLQHAAQHWFTCIAVAPDLIVQLGDTEVQYHNGKITSSIKMTATRLYDDSLNLTNTGEVVTEELNRKISVNDYLRKRKLVGDSLDSNSEEVDRIMHSVQKVVNGLMLRPTPEVFHSTGKFILHTDHEKRVTGMEWFADSTYCQ